MEVPSASRIFKCDRCGRIGVIILDKQSLVPVHKTGSWFAIQSNNGDPEDFCGIPCMVVELAQIKFNRQTELTITQTLVRDKE